MLIHFKGIFKDKDIFYKILFSLSLFLFLLAIINFLKPRNFNIYEYYKILDEQKNKAVLEKADLIRDGATLEKCNDAGKEQKEYCYLKFYKAYTLKNGPQKALSHLATILDKYPNLVSACHYISHGIGEGAYIRSNYSDVEAFKLNVADFFSNVGACGNGYYHGISIGMVRRLGSEQEIINHLRNYCDVNDNRNILGMGSCKHGLGHAIMAYNEGNVDKSMNLCKKIFETERESFECYTGVIMDEEITLDSLGTLEYGLPSLVKVCSKYEENSFARQACIVERSGRVARDENKNLFSLVDRTQFCQQLPNIIEKKACTKLMLIHAVRIYRSVDANNICKQIKDRAGRIECTAFYASYFSLAVDINRGEFYTKVREDVCHLLPYYDYLKCKSILLQKIPLFNSANNYGSLLNFKDIKLLYNDYFGQ